MAIVMNTANLRAAIGALGDGTASLWGSATVHLYQNDVTPTVNSLLADFTEATFDGYGSATITWGSATNGPGDEASVYGTGLSFIATGDTTPNIIYGWWLQNAGGFRFAERFDEPIPIASTGDDVTFQPRASIGNPLL